MASQLPCVSVITPSCSIIGSKGVNENRPMPMATAKAIRPDSATTQGLREPWAEGLAWGGTVTVEAVSVFMVI